MSKLITMPTQSSSKYNHNLQSKDFYNTKPVIRYSLPILALMLVFSGCNIFGSSDDEPEVAEVLVIGTKVQADFLNTGRFGLSATPLDIDGSSILSEKIKAEVELRAVTRKAVAKLEHGAGVETQNSIVFVTNVDVERVQEPSGNDLAVPVNLDGSGSMSWTDPNRNRVDATIAFFNELENTNITFESALFEFPGSNTNPDFSRTSMYQGFTSDLDLLREAADKVTAGGLTPMWNSMLEVIEYSESQRPFASYEKAVVLLGDGLNNQGNATLQQVCDASVDYVSPVYGIGFGPASDVSSQAESAAVEAMRLVSECSGGTYIGVPDEELDPTAFANAFRGFAVGTSQGSLVFAVQIESGLEEIRNEGVERLEGTLRVTSGGKTAEGNFIFGIPESSSSGTFKLR